MPSWVVAILVAMAAAVPIGVVVSVTIFGQTYTYQSPGGGGHYQGAPAPVVGAGIPLIVLAGGGYWAYRRFRKKVTTGNVESTNESRTGVGANSGA